VFASAGAGAAPEPGLAFAAVADDVLFGAEPAAVAAGALVACGFFAVVVALPLS
jgi:hypothetical protein